jgi:hypothetical protein
MFHKGKMDFSLFLSTNERDQIILPALKRRIHILRPGRLFVESNQAVVVCSTAQKLEEEKKTNGSASAQSPRDALVSCSTRARVARAVRRKGCAAPPIRKDLVTASYGCLAAPGETMQQKVGRRDTTPDLFLKYHNTTVATYV